MTLFISSYENPGGLTLVEVIDESGEVVISFTSYPDEVRQRAISVIGGIITDLCKNRLYVKREALLYASAALVRHYKITWGELSRKVITSCENDIAYTIITLEENEPINMFSKGDE